MSGAPIDKLLPHLDRVRRVREGSWSACCPHHDDRGPSLSVRELDDGRLLLHCFAGCDVEEVVNAVGLTLEDLFPPRSPDAGGGTKRERRPFSAIDLLDLAAFEASVCVMVAADMLSGKGADRERLLVAAGRLADVAEAAHGRA
jgi:hypothetical protein